MALQTRITSADLPRVRGALRTWAAGFQDLSDFWREAFAPRYLADIQENFEQEGALVGGWPPLAPGYAAWKALRYGAHLKILELSLRLRGSLQWLRSGRGGDIGPEGIFRPMPRSVVIGTAVPYAVKHHYGREGMRRRQILFSRGAEAYQALWLAWIVSRWQKSAQQTGKA